MIIPPKWLVSTYAFYQVVRLNIYTLISFIAGYLLLKGDQCCDVIFASTHFERAFHREFWFLFWIGCATWLWSIMARLTGKLSLMKTKIHIPLDWQNGEQVLKPKIEWAMLWLPRIFAVIPFIILGAVFQSGDAHEEYNESCNSTDWYSIGCYAIAVGIILYYLIRHYIEHSKKLPWNKANNSRVSFAQQRNEILYSLRPVDKEEIKKYAKQVYYLPRAGIFLLAVFYLIFIVPVLWQLTGILFMGIVSIAIIAMISIS